MMINNLMFKPVFNCVTIHFRFRTKRGMCLFYNEVLFFFCECFFQIEGVLEKFHIALSKIRNRISSTFNR